MMITDSQQRPPSKQQVYGKQTYRKFNSDDVRGHRQVRRDRKERLQQVRQRELMGDD